MTMTLIETKTLPSAAAQIEFTSIPQTFTDLYVLISARSDRNTGAGTGIFVTFNSITTGYTVRFLSGAGSSVGSSETFSSGLFGIISQETNTANTFGNLSGYIPNYSGNTNKSWSADCVTENNETTAFQRIFAGLLSNTAAISSIKLDLVSFSFVVGSTISLYGITKGSDGITTVS